MISIFANSANELFAAACEAVDRDGEVVRPRGMSTKEVLGAHLCLTDSRRRLVDLPPARVINPAFAVAETIWILSGSDDPWIFDYNRALTRYADDGRLQGAYGPRMRRWGGRIDQLDQVRRLLARDPDSRQGVIQLFDPGWDMRGYRDVPCTLGYRFFLRSGRLHMHTTMRSQDLWLGFPYDVFAATVLHELMAGWLGVQLGEYHHFVDSLHIYAEHASEAAIIASSSRVGGVVASDPMPALDVTWPELSRRLSQVIAGTVPSENGASWTMFASVMASYRDWAAGDRPHARTTAAATPGVLGRALERWYDRLVSTTSPDALQPGLTTPGVAATTGAP